MKYVKAIKWLFLVALFGVSMTSCAVLGSLLGGNAQIFMTYPELGSTVTITNSSQVITLKGTVTSDVDIDTVTINPNGVGLKPATFFAGNWDVDLSVTPQDYTIEVTAKDVNGAESKETFSFTVVSATNASNTVSSMQFNVRGVPNVVYTSLNNSLWVGYNLNNSAYPVEIDYSFTNIGKSWLATNVNSGGDGSFDIPVSSLNYLTEGSSNYVDVQAVDYANSVTVHDGFILILDTTPPTMTLTGIASGQTNAAGDNVVLHVHAQDSISGVGLVNVYDNASLVTKCSPDISGVVDTNVSISISAGNNVIQVQAYDNLNNYTYMTNVIVGTN